MGGDGLPKSAGCAKRSVSVLFIHGILGTPHHFDALLPMIPSDWSVHALWLKGHGGSVKDLSRASMTAWKQQVRDSVKTLLAAGDRVVIAAHSMGTLFAIQEALENPIEELFLLNVPLKVRITRRLFRTVWRVFRGNIKPDDDWMLAAQRAYGIEHDGHIFRYLGWIPRYLELFYEIRKTRKSVAALRTKTQVYLSLRDEMVSPKCGDLFKQNACVTVKMLSTSGHFYYSPEDQAVLKENFGKLIQRVTYAPGQSPT